MNLFLSIRTTGIAQNAKFSCKNVSCNKRESGASLAARRLLQDEARAATCVYMTPNIQLKSEKLKQPSRCFVYLMPNILMSSALQMFGIRQILTQKSGNIEVFGIL